MQWSLTLNEYELNSKVGNDLQNSASPKCSLALPLLILATLQSIVDPDLTLSFNVI